MVSPFLPVHTFTLNSGLSVQAAAQGLDLEKWVLQNVPFECPEPAGRFSITILGPVLLCRIQQLEGLQAHSVRVCTHASL
jgi:hypothetical protein